MGPTESLTFGPGDLREKPCNSRSRLPRGKKKVLVQKKTLASWKTNVQLVPLLNVFTTRAHILKNIWVAGFRYSLCSTLPGEMIQFD